jgi:predicted ATPase/transcriptional regulator with XRE-family HTH domain
MSEQTSFGALLKRYRTAAGLTQEALAARAQISARTIADLERGINRRPRHETFELLAGALNVTAQQRALFLALGRPDMLAVGTEPLLPSRDPLPPSALIGREQEVLRAVSFLTRDGMRLLTVTGPAGVGKTHLALHLAHELGDAFSDGIVFVPLAPLSTATLVPGAIAHALALREVEEGQTFEQVTMFLRDKHVLLLLDNFEQLLEAAPAVADLLSHCPRLSVLVTSRMPLRLRAEQVLPLAPLLLTDAVTLFQARARAIRPEGVYPAAEVAAICERLDRLPLAIELVAMHVTILALSDLSERLTQRLALLRQGARDLPARQQTMEEAITWSYELLTEPQQQCFRALGVFVGGWTLEAAEATCQEADDVVPELILFTLAALVDASLVQVVSPAEGPARFGMLELIRDYALQRLREGSEEEAVRRRHARYFARLAETVPAQGPRPRVQEVSLLQEIPNVRAAMQWAEEHQEVVLGLQLARFSWGSWFRQHQVGEAERWLARLLTLSWHSEAHHVPLVLRAETLYVYGQLLLSRDKTEQAETAACETLVRARRIGDDASLSSACALLGQIAQRNGNLDAAEAWFLESDEHALSGSYTDLRGITLRNLAEIARLRGNLARATTLYETALVIAQEMGIQWGVAMTMTLLGHLAYQQRQYAQAKARYRESLPLFRAFASPPHTAWCLEGFAATLCAEERFTQATRLCAAAATLREEARTPLPPSERDAFDQVVAMARAAQDPPTFEREWHTGMLLTQEEAIAEALAD